MMIDRFLSSLRFRLKRYQLGLASQDPGAAGALPVRISGKRVELTCPPEERSVFVHEFGEIFLKDCYRLEKIPGGASTVLDIGANLGLFSLAARRRFPKATIHCYEPNPAIAPLLRGNVGPFAIACHIQAVGLSAGLVSLQARENSLHSVTGTDGTGVIPQISFAEAVERIGGSVDVLKLDCEGAEWQMFEQAGIWDAVKHLTMEYHLWAMPGSSLDDLFAVLGKLGFVITNHSPSAEGSFGLLQAQRKEPSSAG